MRPRSIIRTALYGLLALALLSGAGLANLHLYTLRRDLHLTQAEPDKNMPPLVAFTTVALGGFRSLLADVLWLRASELQDRGQYFELVQLADWITKLQPRSASVWTYQAWNMAYNISALMPEAEDKWRWIQNGLTLLRDEGMVLNPGSPRLHQELAWMYLHKLSADSDEFQRYYQAHFKEDMERIIGPAPRPDYAAADDALIQKLRGIRLDITEMQALESKLSPLDWRRPETHAIYWAATGLPYALKEFDELGLRRIIYQTLMIQVQHGDYDLLPAAIRAIQDTLQRIPNAGTEAALQNLLNFAQAHHLTLPVPMDETE